MRIGSTPGVASKSLKTLLGVEAYDMNLDSAVGVTQAPLQQSAKLPQQRKYRGLVFLEASDILHRHARNQDKNWTLRSFETHRSLAPNHYRKATIHWSLVRSMLSWVPVLRRVADRAICQPLNASSHGPNQGIVCPRSGAPREANMLERTKAQSPFYNADHDAFREVMRRFVAREIEP